VQSKEKNLQNEIKKQAGAANESTEKSSGGTRRSLRARIFKIVTAHGWITTKEKLNWKGVLKTIIRLKNPFHEEVIRVQS